MLSLDVAGNNAGERPTQVGRQIRCRATLVQIQACHGFMCGHERLLVGQRDFHLPVVEE